MKSKNWERIDLWAADLLGVPLSMLWKPGVTVGMHAGLGDYPGIVTYGREGGVHVSLPEWAGADLIDELVEQSPYDLMSAQFWKGHPATEEHKVLGPTIHSFTDEQLEASSKVEQVPASDLAGWEDLVSKKKWEASGFAEHVGVAFAIRSGDEIAAAANLTVFRGVPSDVGVLTHPKYRGKGFGSRVAKAATSYAVRSHEIARYRAEADNPRSTAIAESLGFENYFAQLAIRPR